MRQLLKFSVNVKLINISIKRLCFVLIVTNIVLYVSPHLKIAIAVLNHTTCIVTIVIVVLLVVNSVVMVKPVTSVTNNFN
jgi:hypothetical protein